VGNFCEAFNLAIWRIFLLITKFKIANNFLCVMYRRVEVLAQVFYLANRPPQPWPRYQNSNMIFRQNSYTVKSLWWSGNARMKPASTEQLSSSPMNGVQMCFKYDGFAHSSPLQIHPYFSYFFNSSISFTVRLPVVVSNRCSLSPKPHPLVNLNMRILKTSHTHAVSELPNLKSSILQNSQFAKCNAHQIFPLYGI